MATYQVKPPFPTFTDIDGTPLDAGSIYIGTAGLDPETNAITAYFNFAQTSTAAQPIETINGYPSNSGTPAKLFVAAATYSIKVKNKNGTTIYTSLNERSEYQLNNEYATVAEAKADAGLKNGDFVTTLGYYTKGDGGGAQYIVVNSSPGNLGFVNHLLDVGGLWLELQHNGSINLKQAGAYGDGDYDLDNIPTYNGHDDTLAIQQVFDMVAARTICDVFVPEGVYNHDGVQLYADATGSGLRGNFRLLGAGYVNPRNIRSESAVKGTVFKAISTSAAFKINEVDKTTQIVQITLNGVDRDAYNTDYAMSNVEVGNMSFIGKTTANNPIVTAVLVVGSSHIHDITVYQEGAGTAFFTSSCYTTKFRNIFLQGLANQFSGTLADRIPVANSRGLYIETDYGRGAMQVWEDVTCSAFDINCYIGHTTVSGTLWYQGMNGSVMTALQCTGGNTNLKIGLLTTEQELQGADCIKLIAPYFELPNPGNSTSVTGTNIHLTYSASIDIDGGTMACSNGFIDGSIYRKYNVRVTDEYMNAAGDLPDSIIDGGSITINGMSVTLIASTADAGNQSLIELPDSSYYSVNLTNIKGRAYIGGTANDYVSLVMIDESGAAKFYGSIYMNNIKVQGMANDVPFQYIGTVAATPVQRIYYLRSDSTVWAATHSYGAADLDLSFRPYLPGTLKFNDVTQTITLPAYDVMNKTSSLHTKMVIFKSVGTGVLTLNTAAADANTFIVGANGGDANYVVDANDSIDLNAAAGNVAGYWEVTPILHTAGLLYIVTAIPTASINPTP